MSIKKTLFASLLAVTAIGASAQEAETEYVFKPHYYVQAQVGAQYTLGEIGFGKLISPNAQIGIGYNFDKVIGARFVINAWQSKAGTEFRGETYKWKWNYIAPAIDVTFNLSNLIAGVNPNRLVDVTAFVGGGVNIGFNNDEAKDVYNEMAAKYGTANFSSDYEGRGQNLRYLWDNSTARMVGRFGLAADFKVAKKLSVGLELDANFLSDTYNSKKAGNTDWYYNALVGVKYTLGDTHTEKKIEKAAPEIIYRDRVVEKIVEKPVEVAKPSKDPLRIDVFFTIASTKLVGSEAQKVNEIANYLNKYPESKVTITGYADKGTGNAKINNTLSEKRANIVKDELIKKYNIAENRIKTDFKGDTVQPFDVEVLNRVSICVAE